MPKTKATPAPLVLVRLQLPRDQHTRLRVLAAQSALPMSQFVRKLVEEKLQKSSV